MFERRICKSFWIGNSITERLNGKLLWVRVYDNSCFVVDGLLNIQILGFYIIIWIPKRLSEKIETAVSKYRLWKWQKCAFISEVKTYPGEAKWTSDFTPPTEPYGN